VRGSHDILVADSAFTGKGAIGFQAGNVSWAASKAAHRNQPFH
jgi:hypothetical protein